MALVVAPRRRPTTLCASSSSSPCVKNIMSLLRFFAIALAVGAACNYCLYLKFDCARLVGLSLGGGGVDHDDTISSAVTAKKATPQPQEDEAAERAASSPVVVVDQERTTPINDNNLRGNSSSSSSSSSSTSHNDEGNDDKNKHDDPSLPHVAWLMSYPKSGNAPLLKLLQQTTNTTGGTNYGTEQVNSAGGRDFDSTRSIPIHNASSDATVSHAVGPFVLNPNLALPKDYILTKAHCKVDKCYYDCHVVPSAQDFLQDCARGSAIVDDNNDDDNNNKVPSSHKTVLVQYDTSKAKRAIHLYMDPLHNVYKRSTRAGTREGFLQFCNEYNDKYKVRQGTQHYLPIPNEVLEQHASVPCHAELYKYIMWHNYATQATNEIMTKDGHEFPTLILFIEDLYKNHNDDQQQLFDSTWTGVLDFLYLERKSIGAPLPAPGKSMWDILTPSELEESVKFIQKYASSEVWSVLQERYISKYPLTTLTN